MSKRRGGLVELPDGNFIEEDILGVIAALGNYDPNLKVQYLNSSVASITDPPYRLVELCKDGVWRTVFDIWKLDMRVLDRVYAADLQKSDPLAAMDKNNAKIKKENQQRYRETMEEAKDIVTHLVRDRKSSYTVPTVDGGVTQIFEDRPAERIK